MFTSKRGVRETLSKSRHSLVAIVVIVAVVLSGCTSTSSKPRTSTSPYLGTARTTAASPAPGADATGRTRAVAVGSTQRVAITASPMTGVQRTAIKATWGDSTTIFVGESVLITTTAPLPAEGIKITRSYRRPIPVGSAAALAYWDAALGAWHAVPSSISADRRTVMATVHHLSVWTDFTGAIAGTAKGVDSFAANAADWAYYQVGKVFDTRVDAPACSTPDPAWVQSRFTSRRPAIIQYSSVPATIREIRALR